MLTREARKMPRQPLAELRGDVHRLVQGQRPPLDPLLKRLPPGIVKLPTRARFSPWALSARALSAGARHFVPDAQGAPSQ